MKNNKKIKKIDKVKVIPDINDQILTDKIYDILENNNPNYKKGFIGDIPYREYEIVFASYENYILDKIMNFLQDKATLELLRNVPDYDYDTLIIRVQ